MENQTRVKIRRSDKPGVDRKRITAYKAPRPNLFRRALRFVFNPISLSLAGIAILGLVLTLTYFWFQYSERIDLLLRGEVFTRGAGVYSAPKSLRAGEDVSAADLVGYLKAAGYIEKDQQADDSRSRYAIKDGILEIEPGQTAIVDNRRLFPVVRVSFRKDGKAVASITDVEAKREVPVTTLEPKILSSITAEGDGHRKAVGFNDLPAHLVKAVTVTEDRAFFEHYGVNFRGIARALWRRYEGDDNSPLARQGGSSITQQLIKNLLLSNEQSLERKLKEAYMSFILETRLSKEDIFTLYANQIYLGQQAGKSIYGVGEAANTYFGKDVSALNLSEAAFLAGIIRSPNRYNPYKNLEKVTERRNQVLDSMLEAGAISQQQIEDAKNLPLKLVQVAARPDMQEMPYFSQYAEEELPKIVSDPEALQHLRVYTTIDPDLQHAAYDAVAKRLAKLDKLFPKKQGLNAALVAIKPKTGEIVAMIGGRDFLENQFNRATDAQRQPGSVFKPFVYATALNSAYDPAGRVFTPATIFKDEKKVFTFNRDTYAPNNYGDTFTNKDMTLRDALVKSKNVITVDLGMELNIGRVMNLAARAGLPKVERAYPSMALGTAEATPLQMAVAYTTFANLGEKVAPLAISRVTNGEGRTVVAPTAEKRRVLQPDVAYVMDDIMKDVINRGTAVDAQAWGFRNVPGKQAFAGKTGTSRDGWFAGFTPNLVCVVYVGFDDGSDLGLKGADSALPIWADFMKEALREHPDWNGDWQMPDSIRKGEIDTRDGKLIRELDNAQADLIQAQKSVLKNNSNSAQQSSAPVTANAADAFVSNVPPEFRRIELFISGTMPVKLIPESESETAVENLPTPEPSASPFTTWEEEHQNKEGKQPETTPRETPEAEKTVTVMMCPVTGLRANQYCPDKEAKTFKKGEEPKEFCRFHVAPSK
jgi:penicillin-binding protein 1B